MIINNLKYDLICKEFLLISVIFFWLRPTEQKLRGVFPPSPHCSLLPLGLHCSLVTLPQLKK